MNQIMKQDTFTLHDLDPARSNISNRQLYSPENTQVVLKIVKHCRESIPATVTGQLMGLDVNGVLEVTHSFPMPKNNQDSEDDGKPVTHISLRDAAAHLQCNTSMSSWFNG